MNANATATPATRSRALTKLAEVCEDVGTYPSTVLSLVRAAARDAEHIANLPADERRTEADVYADLIAKAGGGWMVAESTRRILRGEDPTPLPRHTVTPIDAPAEPAPAPLASEGARVERFGPWGSEVVTFVHRVKAADQHGPEVWEDDRGYRFPTGPGGALTPNHWRPIP